MIIKSIVSTTAPANMPLQVNESETVKSSSSKLSRDYVHTKTLFSNISKTTLKGNGKGTDEKGWTGLHYLCEAQNCSLHIIESSSDCANGDKIVEQDKSTFYIYCAKMNALHLKNEKGGMTTMDRQLQTPLHYLCRAKYCSIPGRSNPKSRCRLFVGNKVSTLAE